MGSFTYWPASHVQKETSSESLYIDSHPSTVSLLYHLTSQHIGYNYIYIYVFALFPYMISDCFLIFIHRYTLTFESVLLGTIVRPFVTDVIPSQLLIDETLHC